MSDLNPQFIRSPSGDELVVLTRAEYDALIASAETEDEDDAAIFDARIAELKAGIDEALPPEVTAFMLQGDRLLKAVRRWKGMTQDQLASAADVPQSYISAIESGKRPGTHQVLRHIANALKVDRKWFGV